MCFYQVGTLSSLYLSLSLGHFSRVMSNISQERCKFQRPFSVPPPSCLSHFHVLRLTRSLSRFPTSAIVLPPRSSSPPLSSLPTPPLFPPPRPSQPPSLPCPVSILSNFVAFSILSPCHFPFPHQVSLSLSLTSHSLSLLPMFCFFPNIFPLSSSINQTFLYPWSL